MTYLAEVDLRHGRLQEALEKLSKVDIVETSYQQAKPLLHEVTELFDSVETRLNQNTLMRDPCETELSIRPAPEFPHSTPRSVCRSLYPELASPATGAAPVAASLYRQDAQLCALTLKHEGGMNEIHELVRSLQDKVKDSRLELAEIKELMTKERQAAPTDPASAAAPAHAPCGPPIIPPASHQRGFTGGAVRPSLGVSGLDATRFSMTMPQRVAITPTTAVSHTAISSSSKPLASVVATSVLNPAASTTPSTDVTASSPSTDIPRSILAQETEFKVTQTSSVKPLLTFGSDSKAVVGNEDKEVVPVTTQAFQSEPNPFSNFTFGAPTSASVQSPTTSVNHFTSPVKTPGAEFIVQGKSSSTKAGSTAKSPAVSPCVSDGADGLFVPSLDFKPIVELPEQVDLVTGEENEEKLFGERAKLFRQDAGQWKERGKGELKVMRDMTSGRCRIVMRRDQVLKLCANHTITKDMELKPLKSSENAVCWFAQDFSEGEVKRENLAAKFQTGEIMVKFRQVFEDCRQQITHTAVKSVVKANQDKQQSLGALFKVKPGQWECSRCLVKNEDSSTKCPACDAPRPGAMKPEVTTPTPTAARADQGQNSTGQSLADLFKVKPGQWECDVCLVKNDDSSTKCPACDTPRPGFTQQAEKPATTAPSFGFASEDGFKDGGCATGGSPFAFGSPAANPLAASFVTKATDAAKPAASTISFGSKTQETPPASFQFGSGNSVKFGAAGQSSLLAPASSTPVDLSNKPTAVAPAPAVKPAMISTTRPSLGLGIFTFAPTKSDPDKSPSLACKSPHSPDGGFHVNSEGDDEHIKLEPFVQLPGKVELITEEKEEDVVYKERARLLRLFGNEWKKRGVGEVKLLRHRQTGNVRIVMRREKVHKLCLNHLISEPIILQSMSNGKGKAWTWQASDFTAIRFMTEDAARLFKCVVTAAKSTALTKLLSLPGEAISVSCMLGAAGGLVDFVSIASGSGKDTPFSKRNGENTEFKWAGSGHTVFTSPPRNADAGDGDGDDRNYEPENKGTAAEFKAQFDACRTVGAASPVKEKKVTANEVVSSAASSTSASVPTSVPATAVSSLVSTTPASVPASQPVAAPAQNPGVFTATTSTTQGPGCFGFDKSKPGPSLFTSENTLLSSDTSNQEPGLLSIKSDSQVPNACAGTSGFSLKISESIEPQGSGFSFQNLASSLASQPAATSTVACFSFKPPQLGAQSVFGQAAQTVEAGDATAAAAAAADSDAREEYDAEEEDDSVVFSKRMTLSACGTDEDIMLVEQETLHPECEISNSYTTAPLNDSTRALEESEDLDKEYSHVIGESRKSVSFIKSTLHTFRSELVDPSEYNDPIVTCQTNVKCLQEILNTQQAESLDIDTDELLQVQDLIALFKGLEKKATEQQRGAGELNNLYHDLHATQAFLDDTINTTGTAQFDSIPSLETTIKHLRENRLALQSHHLEKMETVRQKVMTFCFKNQDIDLTEFRREILSTQREIEEILDKSSSRATQLQTALESWHKFKRSRDDLSALLEEEECRLDSLDEAKLAEPLESSQDDCHRINQLLTTHENLAMLDERLGTLTRLALDIFPVCSSKAALALEGEISLCKQDMTVTVSRCKEMFIATKAKLATQEEAKNVAAMEAEVITTTMSKEKKDDGSPRSNERSSRSMSMWKVLLYALPFPLAILMFIGLLCVIDSTADPNLDFFFMPRLEYMNGPPPT